MRKIRSRVKLLRFLEQRFQSGAKGLQSGAKGLQSGAKGLQSGAGITKWGRDYKVGQYKVHSLIIL